MRKVYTKSEKTNAKLAAYSAMAGAFALTGVGANAQTDIIYTDIDDVTLNIGEFTVLDIDGNGTIDYYFEVVENTAGNWSFARLFGYLPTYSYGASNNQFVGYMGAFLPYGSALEEGFPVAPSASFIGTASYGNVGFLASIYSGVTYGQFADQDEKFLGIRFNIDGEVNYGWIRMSATVGPVTLTIHDFAYREGADEGIDAGQKENDDPVAISTIDASKINAYSFGSNIHIAVNNLDANTATVKVLNAVGQTVYSNTLNQSGMQIDLSAAAEGVYIVNIIADGSVYNKEVFISK